MTPGIGGETQRKLLSHFGLPDQIFAAPSREWARVVGDKAAALLAAFNGEAEVDYALAWAEKPGCTLLPLHHPDYPKRLLDTPDPPPLLYVRGDVTALNSPSLAIVGSRNATPQGLSITRQFAREMARKSELVIVSGLALGIDQEAHQGAIEGGGRTVAVIGTGVDRVYPTRHRSLARTIVEHGAVVSEFPLMTPPIAGNFPRRNRVISGLALGVLVVEAAVDSGSLITARLAGEQGREVFAIPGSIHSPLSKGCHRLLREGAKLVECVDDIFDELHNRRLAVIQAPINEAEGSEAEHALLAALGHGPMGLDALAETTAKSAAELLPMLLDLELRQRVAPLPGNLYQRL